MNASKRILICGLGSMGKRRLRLLQLNYPDIEIFGTDIRCDRCRQVEAEFNIRTFNDYKTAYEKVKPFAVFLYNFHLSDKHAILVLLAFGIIKTLLQLLFLLLQI